MQVHRSSDPTALSALQLGRAIQARELSCREVMTAYLAQIERLNPTVNALVSLQAPQALLRQADERDAQLRRGESMGWMHGFPQAPKDLAATVGIPTTLGFRGLAGHLPAQDAIVVERMRRAGAIFVGKSNTPEFGLGSHTYNQLFGTTRNAWDPGRTAGGSSGGAAVALALHMLPVADGSDMMGSLRNPAGWNNIYGLRPSLGRVPHGPADELFFQQLGCEGPMGRTVGDLAMLLSVQAGQDPRVPLSLPGDGSAFAALAASPARDVRGARVAWLGDLGGHLPMEEGVLDLCEGALGYFDDIGCTVEAARPAFDMERLWRAWLVLRSFLVGGRLAPFHADPRTRGLLKPEALWEIEQGRHADAQAVYRASCDRSAWYLALGRLFEQHDFLVLPSAQVFAFDAELPWPRTVGGRAMDTYHRWMEVVIGGTLAGLPVISVPAGFNAQGLPMGLQIMGRPRADLELLQLAQAWEQATPFGQREPELLRRPPPGEKAGR